MMAPYSESECRRSMANTRLAMTPCLAMVLSRRLYGPSASNPPRRSGARPMMPCDWPSLSDTTPKVWFVILAWPRATVSA